MNYLPVSNFPIKEKFPEGVQWGINFDTRFPARFYGDLQCKKSSAATLAESNWDMAPALYLQIPLPDKSILGALTFGGVTVYRTDLLFIRDRKGKIRETLECCVMFLDFAIKQYELREMGEVVIYQTIFDSDKLMPYEDYTVEPVSVTGHIHKTTYMISPTKKFVKMKEEDTDTKSFSSFL